MQRGKWEQTALAAYVVFVSSSRGRPPARQQIETTFFFFFFVSLERIGDFKKEKKKAHLI